MSREVLHSRYRIPRSYRRARRKHFSFAGVLVVISVVILASSFLLIRFRGHDRQGEEGLQFSERLHAQIQDALAQLGIWDDLIEDGDKEGSVRQIRIRVPDDLPLVLCNLELTRFIKGLDGEVITAIEHPGENKVIIEAGKWGVVTDEIVLIKAPDITRKTGKIAMIIDDFGYGGTELMRAFSGLNWKLTFSVLPNLKGSSSIADMAFRSGHEVMVHLPMEPRGYPQEDPGEGAIFVKQSSGQITKTVRKAIKSIPHAVGLNNHMGSRATENRRVMTAVLKEVKRQRLFFVDSMTSNRSVAYDLARKMGVKSAKRAMTIDLEDDPEAIKEGLYELSKLAVRDGLVVGIGHARENTLKALREELPKLQKRGFRFVFASEAVR